MTGPYIRLSHNKRQRAFLIIVMDKYSGIIIAWGWFCHQAPAAYGTILKNGIQRFGLPKEILSNNNDTFSLHFLQLACAQLGICLYCPKPYSQLEFRKAERFLRIVKDKFLSALDLNGIKDFKNLNKQFRGWLKNEYYKHINTKIGDTTIDKFMKALKSITIKKISEQELDKVFQVTIHRKVRNDATVSINRIIYQCPLDFIGKTIKIRYHWDNPQKSFIYQYNKPVCRLKNFNLIAKEDKGGLKK